MIGRLNHVAIVVPDLSEAVDRYRDALGAEAGPPQDLPEHGVRVVFVTLPNTKVELLEVLGEGSPVAGFLQKNPSGGIHHICFEVADIHAAIADLKAKGATILGEPRVGAHGTLIVFVHPRDMGGVLVELMEVPGH